MNNACERDAKIPGTDRLGCSDIWPSLTEGSSRKSKMTEDNGYTDADLTNNPFAYSHLIFTKETGDYKNIPDLPGIYFLTDSHRIYVGYGSSLKKRIPSSVREHKRRDQYFSHYHFIMMPVFKRSDLYQIETQFITAANTIIYKNKLEEKYGLSLMNSTQVYMLPLSAWLPSCRKNYHYPVGAIQTVLKMMGIPIRDLLMGDVI